MTKHLLFLLPALAAAVFAILAVTRTRPNSMTIDARDAVSATEARLVYALPALNVVLIVLVVIYWDWFIFSTEPRALDRESSTEKPTVVQTTLLSADQSDTERTPAIETSTPKREQSEGD